MDHFHNENRDYRNVSFTPDLLLKTYCCHPREVPKSSSVHHVGYDVEETLRYSYVLELSGAPPRERAQSVFNSDIKATP